MGARTGKGGAAGPRRRLQGEIVRLTSRVRSPVWVTDELEDGGTFTSISGWQTAESGSLGLVMRVRGGYLEVLVDGVGVIQVPRHRADVIPRCNS